MPPLIRDATPDDAIAIAAIYNDAVLHTTAIWNEGTVDAANRAAWIAERRSRGYPVLVACDPAGRVLGFASFGDWRAFDGYRQTVEHSVYVQDGARHGGAGTALLQALVDRARHLHKHVMVGAVDAANRASIALHLKLGFEQTGRMPEVGCKFGRWLDLVFMQRILDPGGPPAGVRPPGSGPGG